jgi:hypothetical protein
MNIQAGEKYTHQDWGMVKILKVDCDMVQVKNPHGTPWMPMSLLLRRIKTAS